MDKTGESSQFILTGSKQFGILSGVTQSLAGRAGHLELLPFSISELRGKIDNLENTLYKGFYPPIYTKKIRPNIWYKDYIRTYLERDVRQILNLKNLSLFQKFLSLCAARNGQLLNFSELSMATGVDVRTIKSWISVLEASYVIFLLKPHHKNFSKRLIKTSKLYFYDPGLICSLLKLDKNALLLSRYRGAIFESMVIGELLKFCMNHRLDLDLYFWRSKKGVEIDLLFEKNSKLYPIEIKSGKTIHSLFFKNLELYQSYSGLKHGKSVIIFGGDREQIRKGIKILSWQNSSRILR